MNTNHSSCYLVLDQGGHATRALLFSQTGEVIFHTESKIGTLEKPGYIVEHDPDEMLGSFDKILGKTSSYVADNDLTLLAAGLATQRSSFVALSKNDGQALTAVISWQDRRAYKTVENYERFSKQIYQKTGLVLNPHYGASKMQWCVKNINEVKLASRNDNLIFAPLACYILQNILMEKPVVVDPANASRTLLMNVTNCAWDEELLNLFDIKKSWLPTINATQSLFGHIALNQQKVPLHICTGDQNASVFSQGIPNKENVYINVGTGAFALNVQPKYAPPEDSRLLTSILYSSETETLYATEGTVNGAGRALQWLADKFAIPDYEDQLESWLDAYQDPPIFINGISGVGSPYWIPDLESSFEFESSIEEKFVAVTESIIFLLCVNIQQMQIENPEIKRIIISGGLANNNTFCQLLANLSQLKVYRATETEATARGIFTLLSNMHSPEKSLESATRFNPAKNKGIKDRFHHWVTFMDKFATISCI